MKGKLQKLGWAVVVVLWALGHTTAWGQTIRSAPAAKTNAWAQLDSLLRDAATMGYLQGVLYVYSPDTQAIVRAWGNASVEPLIKNTAKTPQHLGALQQVVNGLIVMRLAERGVFDLDKPLRQWVPRLPTWAASLTPAELLFAPPALPTYLCNADGYPDLPEDFLAWLQKAHPPPNGTPPQPGQNTPHILLALAAERAAGKPWAQLLQDEICTPLGLQQTYWLGPAGVWHSVRRAAGFDAFGNPVPICSYLPGDGAMFAPATELVRLFLAVGEGKVVGPNQLERLRKGWGSPAPSATTNQVVCGPFGERDSLARLGSLYRFAPQPSSQASGYASAVAWSPECAMVAVVLQNRPGVPPRAILDALVQAWEGHPIANLPLPGANVLFRLFTDHGERLALRRLDEWLETHTKAYDISPDQLLLLGQHLTQIQQLEFAEEVLRRGIVHFPKDWRFLLAMGDVLRLQKRKASAEDRYRQAEHKGAPAEVVRAKLQLLR